MNCKVFQRMGLAALVLVLLSGCGRTTHITREDQLAHVTDVPTTAAVTEEATETAPQTTAASLDTTAPAERAEGEEGTSPGQTDPASAKATQPPSTKATDPPSAKATQPPETTVPETTGETLPVTEPTEPAAAWDPYDISGHSCGAMEYALLEAVNAQRREAELPELTLGHRLSAVVSVRAYESSLTFSHTRPDGRDFSTVLGDYGCGYGHAGENLLQCSEGYSASDMVSLWMGSSGHRANILDPEAATLGIGVYRSGGMVYVAVIFTD